MSQVMKHNEQYFFCITLKGNQAVCQIRNILEPGRAERGQTRWQESFTAAFQAGRQPCILFKNVQLSFSTWFFNGQMQFQSADDEHSNNDATEMHYVGNLSDLVENEIIA
jgi:hypothetical protein